MACFGFLRIRTDNFNAKENAACPTATETEVDHVRLFRNHPQLRWKYRVHEQILPGVKRLGCDIGWTEFTGGLTSRRSRWLPGPGLACPQAPARSAALAPSNPTTRSRF